MQRTVVAVVVLLSVVSTCQAGSLQWSGGISITEKTNQSGIFSRIEARGDGSLLGCWFSTSGVLPQVFSGLQVHAFGDFPGIRKIRKVELSPDHGLTRWPAERVEGKGYGVALPYLPPGAYGLEWGVWSKDKRNRLILVIIPINWSSVRLSAAANHLMVQQQPAGWQQMPTDELFAHLRGFVPAWATPDPAFLARQQASQNMARPASTDGVLPPPAPVPAKSEGEGAGQVEMVAENVHPEAIPASTIAAAPIAVAPTRPLPRSTEPSRPMQVMLSIASSVGRHEIPVTIDMRRIRKGSRVSFRNRDEALVEAEVVRVVPGRAIVLKLVGNDSTELAFGRVCQDVSRRGNQMFAGGDVS